MTRYSHNVFFSLVHSLPFSPSLTQHGVITLSDIYVYFFWFIGARFIFHCWIFFVICCLTDYSYFVAVTVAVEDDKDKTRK